jgi:hypothetical protein
MVMVAQWILFGGFSSLSSEHPNKKGNLANNEPFYTVKKSNE